MSARLHHLALGARDVDAVAAFYRETLGLPERSRHQDPAGLRSVWLELGNGAVLMIERRAGTAAPRGTEERGLFLLAVALDGVSLREAERRIVARGVEVEARTGHTLYFRDPEGNRVALSDHPLS